MLYYESNDDQDKAFTICAHYKHGFLLKDTADTAGTKQASADELSSICPPVHLRPHFDIFNGPSSEHVHEVDGMSSSTSVHL